VNGPVHTVTVAWSSERPTTPGRWWWCANLEDTEPQYVEIAYRGQDYFGRPELRVKTLCLARWTPLDEWEGLWQPVRGPEL
jgi:hypothetical protein